MSAQTPPRSVRLWILIATAHTLGCISSLAPAFDDRFSDNANARNAAVLGRLPSPQPYSSSGLLVATTPGAKPELIVYDLTHARLRWRVALRAESRPELLGDLVLTSAEGRLFAFEAASGVARFSAPLADCAYLGAAREEERIFVSCGPGTARGDTTRRNAQVIGLDARTGRVLWRQDARGEIGRPAASAGLVLVPWQRQNLSVLDARNGHELARLRSRDDVIDWVRADARGAFFGERTLYRLGHQGYAGVQQQAKHVRIDKDTLPGRPPIMESAFASQPGSRSARGRIAVYAEPEAVGDDDVRVAYDRYYLAFYRYLFAYDVSGRLVWTRMLGRDVVAGQSVPEGLAVATDDGRVVLLSKDGGSTLRELAIGTELASAQLDAGALVAGAASSPAPALTLRRALTEIALDTDNRLVPARAYAIAELAKLDEPEVTRDLLDIYGQSTTPPELARRLADALRARRTGLEYLVDALAARYDFLEQTRPAPLAVIVPALIDAHERRAVPRLVERMLDHETPLAVLPTVVHAVVELGDDSVLEPLLSLLRLYRADSSFAEQPEALLEAARGVLVRGGEQGRQTLTSLVQDGRAAEWLSAGVTALMSAPSAAGSTAEALAAGPASAPALPAKLGQEGVNATFAEHIDELRTCIIDEIGRNPKLALLRIAFIAESDGSIHALSFAPNSRELVDCLYPKVAAYRFPRFSAGREVASYVISVRSKPDEAASPASGEQGHWWDFYAAAARPSESASPGEPWWRSQQPLAPMVGPSARAAETSNQATESSSAQTNPPPTSATGAAPPAPALVPVNRGAKAKTEAAPSEKPNAAPGAGSAPAAAAAAPSTAPEDAWWTPAVPAPGH